MGVPVSFGGKCICFMREERGGIAPSPKIDEVVRILMQIGFSMQFLDVFSISVATFDQRDVRHLGNHFKY